MIEIGELFCNKDPVWAGQQNNDGALRNTAPGGPSNTYYLMQTFDTQAEAEAEKEKLSRLPEKSGYDYCVTKEQEQKPKRGWRQSGESLLFILLLVGCRWAYQQGGWPYLLSALAVLAVIALLTGFAFRVLRPAIMFIIDEGLVGGWRWLKEKVAAPIIYGRKRR